MDEHVLERATDHSRQFRRLLVAGVFAFLILMLVLGVIGIQTDAAVEEAQVSALPLIREPGDFTLENNRYVNRRYGIEVQFPPGWVVTEATSSNSLISAYHEERRMFAFLNAGIFPDIVDSSEQAYLSAMWRIELYIHGNFARESRGISWSDLSAFGLVGSTSASLLRMESFWEYPDGISYPLFDTYVIFGDGPVYFTLQVSTDDGRGQSEPFTEQFNEIISSVRVSRSMFDQ